MHESERRPGAGTVVGIVLIGLGILFLAVQIAQVDVGHYLWPFFVIVPGLLFFAGMALGGRATGPLAIPGSIVTTVGLLLLYQNTTGHWESWSYAWALIVVAVGAGLIIGGVWSEEPRMTAAGRDVAITGLVLLVLFGAFFELVLNISGFGTANTRWWPVVLILAGVLIMVRRVLWESWEPVAVSEPRHARMQEPLDWPPGPATANAKQEGVPALEPEQGGTAPEAQEPAPDVEPGGADGGAEAKSEGTNNEG